jgi:hypothetical protein
MLPFVAADGCMPSLSTTTIGAISNCKPAENANCSAPSYPICPLTVYQASPYIAPVFYIRGPTYIGICDGIVLDAVVQLGVGGFTYGVTRFEWSVAQLGAIRTNPRVMKAAADASLFSTCPDEYIMCGTVRGVSRFEVPYADLPAATYTVTLTVTNTFSVSATQVISVVKNVSHSVPYVSYMGPNPETAYRALGLQLNSVRVDLPQGCREHQFQLLSGISNRNDVIFGWDILYGDSKSEPLTLADNNPFVLAVRRNRAQTLSIPPSIFKFAELNKNYTLLFIVSMFDVSGLEIRHDRQLIKIMVAESKPIAIILGGSRQVKRANVNYENYDTYAVSLPEPFSLDGTQSVDPDDSRLLCYRWDCLEPTTCRFQATAEVTSVIYDMFSDINGKMTAREAANGLDSILKDGMSLNSQLDQVQFALGITTRDVCRLSSAGTLPSNHFIQYALGNDGAGRIDLTLCDTGLQLYSINTTRIRLNFTVAKGFKGPSGLFSCGQSGDFPSKFSPLIDSKTIDLEVVVEDDDEKSRRINAGWLEPTLQISPLLTNRFHHAENLALRCSDEFLGAQYVWSVSRESGMLIDKGNILEPLPDGLAGGSDTCLLEIPAFSLLPMEREYIFTLTASLADGTQSSAWISVTTANIPFSGKTTVSPTNGMALKTTFSIECLAWTVRSREDLPLSYAFFLKYSHSDQYQIGSVSRSSALDSVTLPRGALGVGKDGSTMASIVAHIMDVNGHLTISDSSSGPIYLYSNRSTIISFLTDGINVVLQSQITVQDWDSFLEILTFAGLEMNEQLRYEAYLLAFDPRLATFDDSVTASFFLGERIPVGMTQNITYINRRAGRALLAAGFSVVAGLQVKLINEFLLRSSTLLKYPSVSTLRKMADLLMILTTHTTDPPPLQQAKMLEVCIEIIQRTRVGDVEPLSGVALQSLFSAVANIHTMIFTQKFAYYDPYQPIASRLRDVDYALTNIGAEGAAAGVARDGKPIVFESANVSLVGFKIAGRNRAVLRAPWRTPVHVEMVSFMKQNYVIEQSGNTTQIIADSRIVLQSYKSQNYVQYRPGLEATILSDVFELRVVDGEWRRRSVSHDTYAVFHILLNADTNFSTLGLDSASRRRELSKRGLRASNVGY